MEDPLFPQWKSAKKFNSIVKAPVHHYVVLLTKTDTFEVGRDLRLFLNITKKPLNWFSEKFQKHGVQVEYGTLFPQRDIRLLGPLAISVSNGIVRHYLQSTYSHSVVFVCAASFTKNLSSQTINPEKFVHHLTQ